MRQNINTVIGENLKTLRKRHKLSQKGFGALLNISFQQYQKYETGKNKISAEKLFMIQNHFRIPYAYFFNNLDDKQGTESPLEQAKKLKDVSLRHKIENIVSILMSQ